MTLGQYIRTTRETMGLSLTDVERLAKKLGYEGPTAQHLSKVERDESTPSIRIALAIGEVLKLDVNDFGDYLKSREEGEKKKDEMELKEALNIILPLIEAHRLSPKKGTTHDMDRAQKQIRAIRCIRKFLYPDFSGV